METASKTCTVCKQHKPIEDFYFRLKSKPESGRHSNCKVCVRANVAKWQRDNNYRHNEKTKSYLLRSKYGLTRDDLNAIIEAQGGRCLICNQQTEKLRVDHCHVTGKVRGLLCHGCNTGIGLLGEEPDRLEAAAAYLRVHHAARPSS